MNVSKLLLITSSIAIAFLSSCQEPQARLPISKSKSSQIDQSIALNKSLIQDEEALILEYISQDSSKEYLNSTQGFWYAYNQRHLEDTYYPKAGDLVTFTYSVMDLENQEIYSESEIGTLTYLVDKEDQLKGLRHAVKLLKEKEKASFIFPSHLTYGYTGDKNKIGKNIPLILNLTLLSIEIKNQKL